MSEQKGLDRPELREALAELEHKQWIYWASSIIRTEPISKERAQRWQRLMIAYDQLTEEQKDQDREWADKTLALIPDIELAYQKGKADGISQTMKDCNRAIEEAKKQEREK